jgi:hypothetical protein
VLPQPGAAFDHEELLAGRQTSDPERLEAIERRLAAATGGPWYLDAHGDIRGHDTIEARRMVARPLMSSNAKEHNAALIANAPGDIAYLLDALACSTAERRGPADRARFVIQEFVSLWGRTAKIKVLHRMIPYNQDAFGQCAECDKKWPCATASALQGI